MCVRQPPPRHRPPPLSQVCSLKTGTIRNLCDPTYKWLEGRKGGEKREKGKKEKKVRRERELEGRKFFKEERMGLGKGG